MTRRAGGLLLFALLTTALLWPAVISGGTLWFADIKPYVRGGHMAVETVLGLFSASPEPTVSEGTAVVAAEEGRGPSLADKAGGVSGARAVAYSVFAYLLAETLPRMAAVALVQAGITAFLLVLLFRREGGGAGAAAFLAIATTAPFVASTASPDAFAAPLVLSMILLVRHGETLSLLQRLAVLAIGGFAVAAHASHILLGGMMAGFALLLTLLPEDEGRRRLPAGAVWAGAVGALGLAATVATAVIGFGEVSAAPKRYPIVLARAVADGPALWHLEAHCETYDYAVCEVFGGEIPDDVGGFLWAETGLANIATAQELDAIRKEEPVILRRAFLDYPFFQARRSVANMAEQAQRFSVLESPLGLVAAYRDEGKVERRKTGLPNEATRAFAVLHRAVFWGSALLIAAGLATGAIRADRRCGTLIVLVIGALFANAAICGILSAPADRYQARLAWLLPLTAWILLKEPGRGLSPIRARRPFPTSTAAKTALE